jgi:hypothetical protein
MKLSRGQQYQFNQLKDDIHRELERNTFPTTIFNTVNNISRVINAIRVTKGQGWAAKVVNDNGQPIFTPVEQQRYTEVFKPYISDILAFFNDKEELPAYLVQKGGDDTFPQVLGSVSPTLSAAASLPATLPKVPEVSDLIPEVPAMPTVEELIPEIPTVPTAAELIPEVSVASPLASPLASPSASPLAATKPSKGKLSKYSSAATGAIANSLSKFDMADLSEITPDVLFDNIMNTLKNVNDKINQTAEAVNFSHDIDEQPDVPIGTTGIMIAPRLIVFLIYYILDITRVAIGMAGNDTGRKLLSILVSILDVIRGDWKRSILTFMGYFGNSPMLIGTALKSYLTVIQMLSPTLQIKLPYFMYDSAKSIIFGLLLSVIQLGAPKPIRDQIDQVLERLSAVQRDIDTKLSNLNPPLSSRPDYFKADFTDLNNLQAILDDPVYVCSAEHRNAIDELLASVGKEGAPAVQLMLSLMRYPHTSGMTKYMCDDKAKKSYVTLLVDEGLQREKDGATPTASTATAATASTVTPVTPVAVNVTKGGRRVLRIRNKHY